MNCHGTMHEYNGMVERCTGVRYNGACTLLEYVWRRCQAAVTLVSQDCWLLIVSQLVLFLKRGKEPYIL